jgi:peroxiredoxin
MASKSLGQQLAAFHDALLDRLNPAEAGKVSLAEKHLAVSGLEQHAVQPGQLAPDFSLPDQSGRMVRLADQLAQGPVVLIFFRGGWCPFCTLTLRAYQAVLPALRREGAELLAVSPQQQTTCCATADSNLLRFPLLADHGNVAPELRVFLKRLGHDLPRINLTDDWRVPLPATFVIAQDGRIAASHVMPVVHKRMEPADALAAVRRLQAGVAGRAVA